MATTTKTATAKAEGEVTIKTLAATLGTDARTLRAFVRGLDLGCGRGTSYRWPSTGDATVKRIVAAWKAAQAAEKQATGTQTAQAGTKAEASEGGS